MALTVANNPSLESQCTLFKDLSEALKGQGFASLTLEYLEKDLRELVGSLIGNRKLKFCCALNPARISYEIPFVYDRAMLRTRFRELHSSDPLKSKPVQVVTYAPEQWSLVGSTLGEWVTTCEADPSGALGECSFIADSARLVLDSGISYTVKAVVDGRGKIQAVSLSQTHLQKTRGICCIEYLVTAPHNIGGKKNPKCEVEGAGALLVEEALCDALADIGHAPKLLPQNALEKAQVKVVSPAAVGYYTKLFFTQVKKSGSYILTGINSALFLSRYGGRG